jgi:hypothetical protein
MGILMKFQTFNESKAQEEIDKLQDDVRSEIEVIVNQWKEDIHECLFDLLDNYEYKNMKVTWDLTPKYSISRYNRDIVKEILNKCKLKYLMTFIISPTQVDDFLNDFNYVQDFLKSHLDANIEIYDLSILKNDSVIQTMSGDWIKPIDKLIEQLNKVKKDSNLKLSLKMKIY